MYKSFGFDKLPLYVQGIYDAGPTFKDVMAAKDGTSGVPVPGKVKRTQFEIEAAAAGKGLGRFVEGVVNPVVTLWNALVHDKLPDFGPPIDPALQLLMGFEPAMQAGDAVLWLISQANPNFKPQYHSQLAQAIRANPHMARALLVEEGAYYATRVFVEGVRVVGPTVAVNIFQRFGNWVPGMVESASAKCRTDSNSDCKSEGHNQEDP